MEAAPPAARVAPDGAADNRFIKHYRSVQAWQAALRHYRWLAGFAPPLRLPALLGADPALLTIDFAHVSGRPLRLTDLPRVASEMGSFHAAVRRQLGDAELAQPLTEHGQVIAADFFSARRAALARRLQDGQLLGAWFSAAQVEQVLAVADGSPACVYKDSNPRNFLFAIEGDLITLDFDDLTLAPPGYDLAKLVVSAAMIHGPIPQASIELLLDRYNAALHKSTPPMQGRPGWGCTLPRLHVWLEVHFVLTDPYRGRGGYRHRWSDVRPPSARSLFDQGLTQR